MGVNKDEISSPTFSIINEYIIAEKTQKVYHIDLYRLDTLEEAIEIGIEEILDQNAWCFIEWPERAKGVITEPDLTVKIRINYIKKDSQVIKITRQIELQWHNRHYESNP